MDRDFTRSISTSAGVSISIRARSLPSVSSAIRHVRVSLPAVHVTLYCQDADTKGWQGRNKKCIPTWLLEVDHLIVVNRTVA
jgi:hypothetical protein